MTQAEADTIINAFKELTRTSPLNLPVGGERKKLDTIRYDDPNEHYTIIINSYRVPEKLTLHAMVKSTKEPLMRLDIVPEYKCHMNPGGEMIYGSHLHFYKEGDEINTALKYDPEDKDFIDICHDFMERFHVINHCELAIQARLLS